MEQVIDANLTLTLPPKLLPSLELRLSLAIITIYYQSNQT